MKGFMLSPQMHSFTVDLVTQQDHFSEVDIILLILFKKYIDLTHFYVLDSSKNGSVWLH